MDKWMKVFQALMQVEETIVPLFVHNPNSQKIAGVVMVAESALGSIVPGIVSAVNAPAPTADQSK
jgi:hypothetical protein